MNCIVLVYCEVYQELIDDFNILYLYYICLIFYLGKIFWRRENCNGPNTKYYFFYCFLLEMRLALYINQRWANYFYCFPVARLVGSDMRSSVTDIATKVNDVISYHGAELVLLRCNDNGWKVERHYRGDRCVKLLSPGSWLVRYFLWAGLSLIKTEGAEG